MDINKLVNEYRAEWLGALKGLNWPDRLQLLDEIHARLYKEVGNEGTFREVSPELVAALIRGLGQPAVNGAAQAHIYANSGDARHRQAAEKWLADQPLGDFADVKPAHQNDTPAYWVDRRRNRRVRQGYKVSVWARGQHTECAMLDLSRGGAGLEPKAGLKPGDRVSVRIPGYGMKLAAVVRTRLDRAGLAFESQLPWEPRVTQLPREHAQ